MMSPVLCWQDILLEPRDLRESALGFKREFHEGLQLEAKQLLA